MLMDMKKKITFIEYLALTEQLKVQAQQNNHSYPTPPKHKMNISSVFAFLQSFSPPLIPLEPYFSEMDIEAIKELHDCARDPRIIAKLEHCYVAMGKMSPLELKMIEEKLKDVASGMLKLEGSNPASDK